ncbi:MAG: hypothetical protein FWF06_04570 [Symbiobacteriaceae bacterium]|nr:hypothetical protein [Symbiobacteriaceae bacterium]
MSHSSSEANLRVLTTHQALAYLSTRRTTLMVGDIVISGEQLYVVAELSGFVTACWRLRDGQKVYSTSFSTGNITPVFPLEGLHIEGNEDINKIDWQWVTAELGKYGAKNSIQSERLILPVVSEPKAGEPAPQVEA